MNTRSRHDAWRLAAATMFAAGTLLVAAPAAPGTVSAQTSGGTFAHQAMLRVWERTDLAVQQGKVARSWVWGPAPGQSLLETFKEGPGGQHLVQYFDKARMEVNDPYANQNGPYFITNGLLVVEMISGRVQTGVSAFDAVGPSDQRIAGDPGSDAPSYGALAGVASVGLPGDSHRAAPITVGSLLSPLYIGKTGTAEIFSQGLAPAQVRAAGYVQETGHNVPDVFWQYLNSQGLVYENGNFGNGRLFDWVSAFGYPVTEPYWTKVRVSGQDRLVLFQAFQRRILTYSPQNPAGWQVEMGNVGQQYYTWRYQTPSLVCQRVPVRGFGRVWAEHRNVQKALGCPQSYPPLDKEIGVQSAYQPFEHGAMLWISRTLYVKEQLIFVFFDDGTYQQFDDTWREGQPVSSGLTPPAGRFEPVRGFGKVWREGTGARVRERLGWATAREGGADGAFQRFERGEMYWSGAADKIWVIYNLTSPSPPQPAGPLTYDVYDDTFSP